MSCKDKSETDITAEYAANAVVWMRDTGDAAADATWNAAYNGVKEFTVSASDLTDDAKLTCTLTGTSPDYGTVYVDENMNLIHDPAEADANDTLHLENCILSVETPNNEYHLDGNILSVVRQRLNGSVTAEAWVYTAAPEKLVEFKYDSSVLRTQKKVTDHGQTVVTDYIYHGKLLAGLTSGNDTLHFFYDAQNRPVKVDCNGTPYTYIHNLQGDIVGLLDSYGSLSVQYTYDVWGKSLSITENSEYGIANKNPFRYHGYIFDKEVEQYYLRSRYYIAEFNRFISSDNIMGQQSMLFGHNNFVYCGNNPCCFSDPTGHAWGLALLLVGLMLTLTSCSINNDPYYNCYAYAVNRTEWMLPGGQARISQYIDPDDPNRINKDYFDVNNMAEDVVKDLGGEENAQIVSDIDSDVPEGWHMIALRTGCTYDSDDYVTVSSTEVNGDFHFMRLDNGVWSHKPGSTAVRYLPGEMTPESAGAWDSMYTSDIVYMIVKDDWE